MLGPKHEKFRSIRAYPDVGHVREGKGYDFSEFTKSDREKSAETLFDWRSRDGWQVSKRSLISRKHFAMWIVIHTVFAASVAYYYFF